MAERDAVSSMNSLPSASFVDQARKRAQETCDPVWSALRSGSYHSFSFHGPEGGGVNNNVLLRRSPVEPPLWPLNLSYGVVEPQSISRKHMLNPRVRCCTAYVVLHGLATQRGGAFFSKKTDAPHNRHRAYGASDCRRDAQTHAPWAGRLGYAARYALGVGSLAQSYAARYRLRRCGRLY